VYDPQKPDLISFSARQQPGLGNGNPARFQHFNPRSDLQFLVTRVILAPTSLINWQKPFLRSRSGLQYHSFNLCKYLVSLYSILLTISTGIDGNLFPLAINLIAGPRHLFAVAKSSNTYMACNLRSGLHNIPTIST
jgi:hypothetical protein